MDIYICVGAVALLGALIWVKDALDMSWASFGGTGLVLIALLSIMLIGGGTPIPTPQFDWTDTVAGVVLLVCTYLGIIVRPLLSLVMDSACLDGPRGIHATGALCFAPLTFCAYLLVSAQAGRVTPDSFNCIVAFGCGFFWDAALAVTRAVLGR